MTTRTLGQVLGDNVRRLRTSAGVTLDQVATAARGYGQTWGPPEVTGIEQGKRSPTLGTALLLAQVLTEQTGNKVLVSDLFAGAGDVELTRRGPVVPLEHVAGTLRGAPVDLEGNPSERIEALLEASERFMRERRALIPNALDRRLLALEQGQTLADRRAAEHLDVTVTTMLGIADEFWGHGLADERDRRAGTSASPQKRGRVTRELVAELREEIDRRRADPPAKLDLAERVRAAQGRDAAGRG